MEQPKYSAPAYEQQAGEVPVYSHHMNQQPVYAQPANESPAYIQAAYNQPMHGKEANVGPAFTYPNLSHPLGGQYRVWHPYVGPFDPCPPITTKFYNTPPQLFIPFQPMNLPQFPPREALKRGVLWPALYSPYEPRSRSS